MTATTCVHRMLVLAAALLAATAFTLAEPPRTSAATAYSTISLGISGRGYVSNDSQPVPYKFRCFAPHPWLGSEPTCTFHIAKQGGLQFRAEPALGWYFSHWEGDCANPSQPCNALVQYVGDMVSVKAVFKRFILLPIMVGK